MSRLKMEKSAVNKQEEGYWELRERKLENQAQKAETNIFNKCVFYILGFVGRGGDSRLRLSKLIEKNGGKCTMMITSHTTHVISRSISHSKRTMLDSAIEKRHLFVVSPDYIKECLKEGKLLDPTPFTTSKQKANNIDHYFIEEKK